MGLKALLAAAAMAISAGAAAAQKADFDLIDAASDSELGVLEVSAGTALEIRIQSLDPAQFGLALYVWPAAHPLDFQHVAQGLLFFGFTDAQQGLSATIMIDPSLQGMLFTGQAFGYDGFALSPSAIKACRIV